MNYLNHESFNEGCRPEQPPSSPLWQKAWRLAAQAHHGQLYPGTELPYLFHIGAVLLELIPALAENRSYNADFAICSALLHDAAEDTSTTLQEIAQTFGQAVRDGVSALSKNKDMPKSAAMDDSLARIRRQPPEIWAVKLADRIANLNQTPNHWTRDKCRAYAQEGELIRNALGCASRLLSQRLTARIEAWKACFG
jgi:(p)ppGpp synthase/HD superfamily hydrolase